MPSTKDKFDLISRDALLEFARNHIDGKIDCNDIARFPYANAEPVRHGRWKEIEESATGHLMECSVCKEWLFHNFNYVSNYCPNCGAKMDGEVDVPKS